MATHKSRVINFCRRSRISAVVARRSCPCAFSCHTALPYRAPFRMTSVVVSRAVWGMAEEESEEESSLSSNDDDDAQSLLEVVMYARWEVSNKECQRRCANAFVNLFRSVASMREVDGTLVVYKERYDLTQARNFPWHGYVALHPKVGKVAGHGVTKFEEVLAVTPRLP